MTAASIHICDNNNITVKLKPKQSFKMPLFDKSHCAHCKKATNGEKDVRCAKCNLLFHNACSGLSRTDLQSLAVKSPHSLSYMCDSCYTTKSGDEKSIEKLSAELKKFLKCELTDISKAIDFFSKKIDDYEEEKKECYQKLKEVQNENKSLKQMVNQIEQTSLETSLEIQGLEIKNDENPIIPVEYILKKLDCEDIIRTNSIVNCYSTKKSITLKLNSKAAKDRILTQKKKNGNFTAKDLKYSSSEKTIFINEKLTPANNQLLWLARSTKSMGYKFAWTKNGRVLLRKTQDSPIIYIKDANDIPLH